MATNASEQIVCIRIFTKKILSLNAPVKLHHRISYALSLCAVFLSSCSSPPLCSMEEIGKKISPNNKFQAIIIETDCGATAGKSEKIYIEPLGRAIKDSDQPIFVADKTVNLEINWTEDDTLQISYDAARIFSFTSFWSNPISHDRNDIVNVIEHKKNFSTNTKVKSK